MRIKLIANPVSGGDARPRIEQAVACLEGLGVAVELFLTAARGDARVTANEAVAAGFDRIIAAAGDGTLNEVVNGVYPARVPVAFLPLGTVNVFALEAGIPRDVTTACHLAVRGVPRQVSLGRINGEFFLLMASAGWDADAVSRQRPGLKRVIGRMAYGVAALEALLARPPAKLEVTFPGHERISGYGVVVSNCRYYGGRFSVTPRASMFSETLEVCVLRRPGRFALLCFASCLALQAALPRSLATFSSVRSLTITGEKVRVQVDGDAWGSLPVTIESLPAAINLVLPAHYGNE